MNLNRYGRSIETEEDVLLILSSEKISTAEYFDCLDVAKRENNNGLRGDVVRRFMEHLELMSTAKPTEMVEVAKEYLFMSFRTATNLDEIRDVVVQSIEMLENGSLFKDLVMEKSRELRKFYEDNTRQLYELQVCLYDPSLDNYSTIAKNLRLYQRPDFAVEICEKGVEESDAKEDLFSAYIAALNDLAHFTKGKEVLKKAIEKFPNSSGLLCAGSRLMLNTGDKISGLDLAKRAFKEREDSVSWHTLLRAAAVNEETELLEYLHTKDFRDDDDLRGDGYIETLAISIFIEEDKLDMAKEKIAKLENTDLSPTAKNKLGKCKSDLKKKMNKRQKELF